jgi:uncharacterized repeat protein (TIGR04052 family)
MRALKLPALLLLATASACTDKEPDETDTLVVDTEPEFTDFTVNFRAVVEGAPFVCDGEYSYLGVEAASTVRFHDFRMFVHNVAFLNDAQEATLVDLDDTSEFQEGEIALLDFEDGQFNCDGGTAGLNSTLTGTVAGGDYSGFSFTVGVPFEVNHDEITESTTAPLNDPTLFRSPLQGYYFLKVDATTFGEANGYPLHVTSSGCQANELGGIDRCISPNRLTFTFPEFDPTRQEIVLDLGTLIARNNPEQNASLPSTPPVETPLGCQSDPTDPDCQQFFISYGMSALPQTWMRVE